MSRTLRNILLIAAAMIILGGVLTGVGFALGGMKPVTIGTNGFQIFDDSNADYINIDESYEDLTAIDIDVDMADIKLVEGDGFSLSGSYHPYFGDLSIAENNKTLSVKSRPKKNNLFNFQVPSFGFGFYNHVHNELIITYPKGTVFKNVSLNSDLGALGITDLQADDLIITLNAGSFDGATIAVDTISVDMDLGSCYLSELNVSNSADLDLNAGSLTVTNSEINNLIADLDMGNFDMSGLLKGTADINMSAGSLDFTLENKEDSLSYHIKTDLGSIDVGGNSLGSPAKQSVKSPSCEIDIDSNLGSVIIDAS